MPEGSALSPGLVEPVHRLPHEPEGDHPAAGIGLCLSGGGYRAMVFHLGALWRLNELGYLQKLDRISSVSGGSITSAVLGMNWAGMGWQSNGVGDNFQPMLVNPIRKLAGKTIDAWAILGGALGPGHISDKVAGYYREYLFGKKTLQALPDRPRFVINATNVQSGALWRFSKPFMRDWRVGEVKNPEVELAIAVAASSAFPPFLSPLDLELKPAQFTPSGGSDLQIEPYTSDVVLTDGGVYDNLGLETVWKEYDTVLVSDGGGKMQPEPEPHRDWARHMRRVLEVIDNQVRSLRMRQILVSFESGLRKGTYWGIRTNIADYGLPTALPCPLDRTSALAQTETRLKRLEPDIQEQLINWGYAVCDAAIRKHVDPKLPRPADFPYPKAGV